MRSKSTIGGLLVTLVALGWPSPSTVTSGARALDGGPGDVQPRRQLVELAEKARSADTEAIWSLTVVARNDALELGVHPKRLGEFRKAARAVGGLDTRRMERIWDEMVALSASTEPGLAWPTTCDLVAKALDVELREAVRSRDPAAISAAIQDLCVWARCSAGHFATGGESQAQRIHGSLRRAWDAAQVVVPDDVALVQIRDKLLEQLVGDDPMAIRRSVRYDAAEAKERWLRIVEADGPPAKGLNGPIESATERIKKWTQLSFELAALEEMGDVRAADAPATRLTQAATDQLGDEESRALWLSFSARIALACEDATFIKELQAWDATRPLEPQLAQQRALVGWLAWARGLPGGVDVEGVGNAAPDPKDRGAWCESIAACDALAGLDGEPTLNVGRTFGAGLPGTPILGPILLARLVQAALASEMACESRQGLPERADEARRTKLAHCAAFTNCLGGDLAALTIIRYGCQRALNAGRVSPDVLADWQHLWDRLQVRSDERQREQVEFINRHLMTRWTRADAERATEETRAAVQLRLVETLKNLSEQQLFSLTLVCARRHLVALGIRPDGTGIDPQGQLAKIFGALPFDPVLPLCGIGPLIADPKPVEALHATRAAIEESLDRWERTGVLELPPVNTTDRGEVLRQVGELLEETRTKAATAE